MYYLIRSKIIEKVPRIDTNIITTTTTTTIIVIIIIIIHIYCRRSKQWTSPDLFQF